MKETQAVNINPEPPLQRASEPRCIFDALKHPTFIFICVSMFFLKKMLIYRGCLLKTQQRLIHLLQAFRNPYSGEISAQWCISTSDRSGSALKRVLEVA